MYKLTVALTILLSSYFCVANDSTPYSGEESRDIKSLSKIEREGYLSGKGMGLAKAAELNGYPGPRHVLDLADELGLDKKQINRSNKLFITMQAEAVRLGSILIEKEKVLDDMFANELITHSSLESTLADIGKIKAEIRQSHLAAHIEQKKIMSQQQVSLYIQHRGYDEEPTDNHSQHH